MNQEWSELLVDTPRAIVAITIAALVTYSSYRSTPIESTFGLLFTFVACVALTYAAFTLVRAAAIRLRIRRSG